MTEKSSSVRLVNDPDGGAPPRIDERVIAGVEVVLEARLGTAAMTVAELMELKAGDRVPLDAALNRDVELRLNGVTVARGELVTVGDSFGVRIVEIAAK
jgi:flagellar motor switch protein FliN/FliY